MDVNPDNGSIPAVDVGALDIPARKGRSIGVPIVAGTPVAGARAASAPTPATATRPATVPSAAARPDSAVPSSGVPAVDPRAVGIQVVDVHPVVERGRRPAKAVCGETFEVTATVFGEGHDAVAANVVLRDPSGRPGPWTPMRELAPGTDRWGAHVTPGEAGHWTYTVEAWRDPLTAWRHAAGIKVPAGIDAGLMLEEGAELYERAASGVPEAAGREAVLAAADALRDESLPPTARLEAALASAADTVLARHPLRERVSASQPLPLLVERRRALYGSWYEFFPRSEGTPGQPHGTFRTAAERLPAIAEMGFDVVYLPPIHPIGTTYRKGPNNTLSASRSDVGVPWA
ncbi:maltotransferase domain-containing protein, partial [Streptomyces sp. NPDC057757]|uniref:maltotransferase domain-containing protein n=1 Tax=Streptomyces sp. NPDC057757 TaxID=3346241 RepID=UPI003687AEAC